MKRQTASFGCGPSSSSTVYSQGKPPAHSHPMQVVDSADLARLEDCRAELHALLQEERLFGATLLIFANKQDVPSALPVEELEKVLPPEYSFSF